MACGLTEENHCSLYWWPCTDKGIIMKRVNQATCRRPPCKSRSISRYKNLGILCRKPIFIAIFHTIRPFLYCIQCWPLINQFNVLHCGNFALGNNWSLQLAKTRCSGTHYGLYTSLLICILDVHLIIFIHLNANINNKPIVQYSQRHPSHDW